MAAHLFSPIVIICLLGGLLSSCASQGTGPQAWIDTPLDDSTAPLAPLSIIAHASANGGVAGLEFTVDGQPYRSVPTDGGRLEWREIEWTPPSLGVYVLGARGVGTDGIPGKAVTARITISADAGLPVPLPGPESLPIPLPQPEALPVPLPQPEQPTVSAAVNANCREGPGTAYATYGNLMSGQTAALKGRLEDNSWFLILLDGRSQNCWIAASVVEVTGDLDDVQVAQGPAPAEAQPPGAQVLEPAAIPVDTTPPTFFQVDAGLGDCPEHSVTVAAIVTDEVGLGSVVADWSMSGGGSGQIQLAPGYLGYVGSIAPPIPEGTMQITVRAADTSGNTASSANILVGITECIK